jgi:hypothetical protein
MGMDVILLVQSFGVLRYDTPPASGEVGKALWDSAHIYDELTTLYNVFAWYALEEYDRTVVCRNEPPRRRAAGYLVGIASFQRFDQARKFIICGVYYHFL